MTWTAVEAITSIACAIATLISSFAMLTVKFELAKFRAEMAEARIKDREELREWINGSFMRAAVAQVELGALRHRVAVLEREA